MVASFTSQGSSSYRPLVVGEDNLQTRQIVLLTGQVQPRGAVLGKISASGKYRLSLAASNDGSEVPAVILAEDADATGADATTPAHFGGVFNENALTIGAGHSKASIRDTLRDVGIKLQSSLIA